MRFMLLVKADKNTEAGVFPSRELMAAMGKFNEEMVKAGAMLAAEGLQLSVGEEAASEGAPRAPGRLDGRILNDTAGVLCLSLSKFLETPSLTHRVCRPILPRATGSVSVSEKAGQKTGRRIQDFKGLGAQVNCQ